MTKGVRRAVFAADFETSTEVDYDADGYVRVYLWSVRDVNDPSWERHGGNIDTFHLLMSEIEDSTVWFHNLKFDMSYYVCHLLRCGFKHSDTGEAGTFSTIITDIGQWMRLRVVYSEDHYNDYLDSLKKFPGFSLETVAGIYGIEGKSRLDVTKRRPPGYQYTQEDLERVQGDTRILAVAVADLYARGMKAMTMAGDAMQFFRSMWSEGRRHPRQDWMKCFPTLKEMDGVLRRGYRGGWTYLNPKYKDVDLDVVRVYDVNSMYPWAMTLPMPYGYPIRRISAEPGELFIIMGEAMYDIKPGMFPTYQRKGDFRSVQADYVEHSDGFE